MKRSQLSILKSAGTAAAPVALAAVLAASVLSGCEKKVTRGWTTHRFDAARSGITGEDIGTPLSPAWVFRPAHPPKPAWYRTQEELPRSRFDNAHYVAVADGKVYFGSTVDNKVYALDADSGEIDWHFFTEGPVRAAPSVSGNRVYFGSDDGYVYCLNAGNGRLVWKYRAGPRSEKLLGNGTMISLWPVRSSVLVDDDTVYFTAGVFPYEGIYVCALNAGDGSEVWVNDIIGYRQHELDYNGISPQGYLLASDDILYVPSGRALPAAFDRHTGEFLYYMRPGGKTGGTWALIRDDEIIAGVERSGFPSKAAYDMETGQRRGDKYAWYPGVDMVVDAEASYIVTEDGVVGLDRTVIADAETRVRENADERKRLNGILAELKEKLESEGGRSSEEIDRQIEEIASDITRLDELDRKIRADSRSWNYDRRGLLSIILAGKTIFAGGEGEVLALDPSTGSELWREPVDGNAFGLAVADGRLFVSTDTGKIHCFSPKGGDGRTVGPEIVTTPFDDDNTGRLYSAAADEILRRAETAKGYCLVLGCGEGRLAFELAKRTDMTIVAIDDDERRVRRARERLDRAGMLGPRVRIERWDISDLPDYFANLVVSEQAMNGDGLRFDETEVIRVLRPCGGRLVIGQPDGMRGFGAEQLAMRFRGAGLPGCEAVAENGAWVIAARGGLEGAGEWTHIYGNPQNTSCSEDELAGGSLGLLWFGEPGPHRIVDRHARSAAPLCANGYLVHQGEEVVKCFDVYNGTFLWERDIPGAVRVRADVDGGNTVIHGSSLFVAAYDICYRLDLATGETVQVYEMPPASDGAPRRWGYISCADGILYGTTAVPLKERYGEVWESLVSNGQWRNREDVPEQHRSIYDRYVPRFPEPNERAWMVFEQAGTLWRTMADFPSWGSLGDPTTTLTDKMMVADAVFAIDIETGKQLWVHRGRRISNISPSVGDGTIFFADSAVDSRNREEAIAERRMLIRRGLYEVGPEDSVSAAHLDVRTVFALDSRTGKKRWERPLELTGCGGDKVGTMYKDGLLYFVGHFSNHDTGYFLGDRLSFRRVTVLDAKTGDVVWSRALNYLRRPLIVGDELIIEPRACDLRTGEVKTRVHPVTGEAAEWHWLRPGHCCAATSASASMLFYRSWTSGIYDLENDRGVMLFGGIRPGCWISLIPASGVVAVPEASAGCTCSFPVKCSYVLKRRNKQPDEWTVFIQPGDLTPVSRFSINFGAPADMKDADGRVWFAYPNPDTRYAGAVYPGYGVKFDLRDTVLEGMGYFAADHRGKTIEGTDKPWLFTTGCIGLTRCEVPVIDPGEGASGDFSVRLGFMARPGDRPGGRPFDIRVQGETVSDGFDIMRGGGSAGKPVVLEFTGIHADSTLVLELVPNADAPAPDTAPLINFIEVVREGELRLSLDNSGHQQTHQ